jgi:hypothetical protein
MIMGKKAQFGNVVGIILIVASAIVLVLFAGKIIDILMQTSSEGKCTASAQLSSSTRIAGVETVSIDCPMKLIEIKMADLRAEMTKSKNTIKTIQNSGKDTGINYFNDTENAKILKEFALDKKVAEEMRACWQKLGEGNLELFNAWYNPLGTESVPWIKWLPKLLDPAKPPTTCVICARIKFDSDIQTDYPIVEESLNEWLKINTVPKREVTYYDFLIDEVHDQFLFTPSWNFTTKEPVAVVFARMSANSGGFLRNMLANFGLTDLGKDQKGIDVLYLIEYSKTREYCDYLANTPPEGE